MYIVEVEYEGMKRNATHAYAVYSEAFRMYELAIRNPSCIRAFIYDVMVTRVVFTFQRIPTGNPDQLTFEAINGEPTIQPPDSVEGGSKA